MDTKALRQKILDLAIHGKLVPQDPNDEPASVLLERIKAEKERLIKEGKIKRSKKSAKSSDTPHYENVPFEVPNSWVWCRLEDIAYVASGSTPDKTCFVENGVPYIKMYNLRNQKIDFAYHPQYITEEVHNGKLQRSRTEVGDLIMNIVGPPLGKLAIIPTTLPQANFNQAAILIRPYKFKEVLVSYLKVYLEEMSEINSIATRGSAGQVNISLTQSQNMRIPIPPLNEVRRIIEEVSKYDILIDSLKQNITDIQNLIAYTKSKIFDLAIHGKLVPQDPNDEPAIELLKRINPEFTPCDNGHYSSMIANGYYDYTNTNPRNGYVSGTNHQNPSLIINGGTFAGGLNTIKNDDGAQLVINDGTFTNMSQATVQNHHVAEIKGGTFNTTGSAQYVVDNEGHNGAANDLGQMTISGGTLNGKIYVVGAGASLAVTGGTFSDPSALAYLGDNADITVKLDTDTRLAKTMIVEKGAATIDLNNHRLTADASATIKIKENGDDVVVAVAVKDGAKVMVKNGNIGDSSNKLSYGVYAFGKADVTLNNVGFSEMVIYAYNGAGKLAATDCIFKGWLSGWHHGGTFAGCTFTIGKAWYPAAICYGSTTFTNCKFFKNEVDADVYDDDNKADSDGYYRCCYVVAQCNPSNSIGFTNCKFIDESNTETGSVAIDNHPFHACGWGNGTAANYNVTVDNAVVTSQCSDKTKTSNENK